MWIFRSPGGCRPTTLWKRSIISVNSALDRAYSSPTTASLNYVCHRGDLQFCKNYYQDDLCRRENIGCCNVGLVTLWCQNRLTGCKRATSNNRLCPVGRKNKQAVKRKNRKIATTTTQQQHEKRNVSPCATPSAKRN